MWAELAEPIVVWNGAIERAAVMQQQRAPERDVPRAPTQRECLTTLLAHSTRTWTIKDMSRALGMGEDAVYQAMRQLIEQGRVTREQDVRTGRGCPQRYRWSRGTTQVTA